MKEADTLRVGYATITTVDYLPRALILRDSIKRHADKDLHILLVDHPRNVPAVSSEISYKLLSLDEVGCPQWRHMSFYYSPIEFSCALKPFLILHCLRKLNYDAVFYFDSDIDVYNKTDDLEALIRHNEIVVTTHIDSPLPEDGLYPGNYQILIAGQVNAGFLGFKKTDRSIELLEWLSSRFEEACLQTSFSAADQFWINAVISFSKDVSIVRSHRYNFAYWNMSQRKLWLDKSGVWQTGDGPLVFFHFSGFGADRPQEVGFISVFQNRKLLPRRDPVRRLAEEYRQKIVESAYRVLAGARYHFGYFSDGSEISEYHRKCFLNLTKRQRLAVGDPFARKDKMDRLLVDSRDEVYKKYIAARNISHEFRVTYDELSRLKRQVANPDGRLPNGRCTLPPRRTGRCVLDALSAFIADNPKFKAWGDRVFSRFPALKRRLRSFVDQS